MKVLTPSFDLILLIVIKLLDCSLIAFLNKISITLNFKV
nr:MAG TPA: hypothetical protein [Caudoviricetes sp.]DAZ30159.1 MAG TPA: hypothetical protein [Caudoviricetes sp.]